MSNAAIAVVSAADSWQADAYDLLASSRRMISAIQRERSALRQALPIIQLNSSISQMIVDINGIIEGKSAIEAEPVAAQDLEAQWDEAIRIFRRLEIMLNTMVEGAKKAGFLNSTLVGYQFRRLAANAEGIADIADWLATGRETATVEDIYRRGAEEFERGEFMELNDVPR